MTKDEKKSPLEKRIEALEAEMGELQTELEDEKGKALRALADLQNFQRRESEAKATWAQMAVSDFLEKNLKKYLELKLALDHTKDKDVAKVITSFFEALEKTGFTQIKPEAGETIDPDKHEVLMTAEGIPGTIVQTLESGWEYQGKTLQPAKISAALE